MKKYYTGIGSRETPRDILAQMYLVAKKMALKHWVLRSGGSPGADSTFEQSCKEWFGECEIYLPWDGFNNKHSEFSIPPAWAIDITLQYHPKPEILSNNVYLLMLMARNVQQILGKDLKQEKSKFVVCWTPDGAEREEDTSKNTGGTGQAIRIASAYDIPVFNLKNQFSFDNLIDWLDSLND